MVNRLKGANILGMTGIRFAPSPTGRFHIGNLRTAWVSHRIARAMNEPWVLRVEDIDTARSSLEFRESQLADLKSLGLLADDVVTQSAKYERHLELFERARQEGRVYPCDCSRRDVLEALALIERAPHAPPSEYSGHCRHRSELSSKTLSKYTPAETLAWRWKMESGANAETGQKDAIVARTDASGRNFVAGYHWACAIDDADGAYRVLVRAWDLAGVDDVQREIRSWTLGTPDLTRVFHTALVTRGDGGRLEKRTQGVTLEEMRKNGVTSERIIEAFNSSFDVEKALEEIHSARRPMGEPVKSLSLTQLSL